MNIQKFHGNLEERTTLEGKITMTMKPYNLIVIEKKYLSIKFDVRDT